MSSQMAVLRLPASIESFEPFRSFALAELERESGLAALLPRLELVLEELLINIINYAYRGGEGEIEVECEAPNPKEFRLRIRDWGAPFNPLEQQNPDLSADIQSREVGGVGIFLVKQMTSGLTYQRLNGANILTAWFEN
ncbi:MAG: ATP-binding protein [Syntrophobacteraceae bacterium]